ncbi:MAG: hypothetical protein IPO81_09455 [Kouleothrix sp.]|nr:hypothetical protein [Kouleothrix sp.]
MSSTAALDEATLDDYGTDGYIWRDGQRLRVKMVRTVQPRRDETNSGFEHRMDRLMLQLARMASVLECSYEFERRGGSISLCSITVITKPTPSPIIVDERPAGARHAGPRGGQHRQPASV